MSTAFAILSVFYSFLQTSSPIIITLIIFLYSPVHIFSDLFLLAMFLLKEDFSHWILSVDINYFFDINYFNYNVT